MAVETEAGIVILKSTAWDYEENAETPWYHIYMFDGPFEDEVELFLPMKQSKESDEDIEIIAQALDRLSARVRAV